MKHASGGGSGGALKIFECFLQTHAKFRAFSTLKLSQLESHHPKEGHADNAMN